jgi:hypothetical protein
MPLLRLQTRNRVLLGFIGLYHRRKKCSRLARVTRKVQGFFSTIQAAGISFTKTNKFCQRLACSGALTAAEEEETRTIMPDHIAVFA